MCIYVVENIKKIGAFPYPLVFITSKTLLWNLVSTEVTPVTYLYALDWNSEYVFFIETLSLNLGSFKMFCLHYTLHSYKLV